MMSSLMTPMDARSETNKNRVRMFSHDTLSEPERNEKWDRIKVVCSQPFNKHMQYGLSFIVLHSSDSKVESAVAPKSPNKTLGRFALKDEEESNFSLGSFFSRRKDLLASPPPAPLIGIKLIISVLQCAICRLVACFTQLFPLIQVLLLFEMHPLLPTYSKRQLKNAKGVMT